MAILLTIPAMHLIIHKLRTIGMKNVPIRTCEPNFLHHGEISMRRSKYPRPQCVVLFLGTWLTLSGLTLAQSPLDLGRVQFPNPNYTPGYPSNYLSNPGYYLGTTQIYSAMTNPIYRIPMSGPSYGVAPGHSYWNMPSDSYYTPPTSYGSGYSNQVYPTTPNYYGTTGYGTYNGYSGYNSYTPSYAAPSYYYAPQFYR
jgi:hypothetical protein